jgi:hypothetical protein
MSFILAQGNFQLPGGGPVAAGVLTLTLSNPSATVIATGAGATPSYTFTLDANGNLPAGSTVLGNAELTPAGTFYTASLVTSGGTSVPLTNNVWVVGPSAPYAGTLFPDVTVYPLISSTGGSTVGGVTISGTPTTGQVITATSSSAANWQAPATPKFPDGTVSAPGITFTNETNSGLYRSASGDFRFSVAGTDEVRFDANGLAVAVGDVIRWGSSGVTSADTGISRLAAGSLALGNGTASDTSAKLTCSRVFTSTSNANVTPVTVTGTTSQTALQAVTVLSGELNTVGRWLTIRARGFLSSGATGGTITLVLKIGTTNLITLGAFTLANNLPNNAFLVEADIMAQTAGATGALEVQANALLNNVSSAAFFNTATINSIDLTGAPTFTLFSTATQTTTSITSRMMGYQRNN